MTTLTLEKWEKITSALVQSRLVDPVMDQARKHWPNFDQMPPAGQLDCVADCLDTPLGRWMRERRVMADHEGAYA